MFQALVVVATLFIYVSAQSVSKQCLDAWKCLAVDPVTSACLSVEQALPLATAIQNNASVVPILNNWFSSMCCQPACSTKTITAVHGLLLQKCSGLDDWTFFDPRVYPTWRKDVCLKNANGTLCITEFLTDVESYSGTVTFSKFQQILVGQGVPLPANISCTNCSKAAYNIWATDFPSAVTNSTPAIQALCGAAFVDGQAPPGITQGANTTTSTATTTLESCV